MRGFFLSYSSVAKKLRLFFLKNRSSYYFPFRKTNPSKNIYFDPRTSVGTLSKIKSRRKASLQFAPAASPGKM
ncbi:hypothetical protein CH380_07145 [Leptospira adleri]|uniref:Uncharacterized protein n=1 Tax=Leptospira adleri TaxID=2023186 RepID=A0A2M9YQH7_9LEPT|nr:hypothetical protein CH380_07145 [Leptospira adleri]